MGQSLIPPAPLTSNLVEKRFSWNQLLQSQWKLQRCRPLLWWQKNVKAVLYCYVHPNGSKRESHSKGPLINNCWSDWISPSHRCYYLRFPYPPLLWYVARQALLKRIFEVWEVSPSGNGNQRQVSRLKRCSALNCQQLYSSPLELRRLATHLPRTWGQCPFFSETCSQSTCSLVLASVSSLHWVSQAPSHDNIFC